MTFTTGFGRYAVGPGRLFVEVVEQSVSSLLDTELDVEFGEARAHVVLRSVHLEPTPIGMVTGTMEAVDVALDDVAWEGGRLDALRLHARRVRITPGVSPALVAQPVHVEAELTQATLDEWLTRARVAWRIKLAGAGYVEVRWPGRESWGHAVFTSGVRDNVLHLAPEEVVVRGHSVKRSVQRFAKPIEWPIPPLPGGARVTGVRPSLDRLVVTGVVDQIREPLSIGQIRQMRRAVQRFATQLPGARRGPLILPRTR